MARPPRLRGFTYCGRHAYFLTFCTFRRRPVFRHAAAAEAALAQFRRTASTCRFVIYAYCLMPDHVHMLVEGASADADLRRFVKSAKQSTGQRFARGSSEPLWHPGYYDRVVRPEESLIHIARYILLNPVRAGLAPDVEQYRLSGSDVWPIAEIMAAV